MGFFQKISNKIGNLLSGESAKSPNKEETSSVGLDETVLESKETPEVECVAPEGESSTPKEEKKPLPNSVEIRRKIKKSTLVLLNSLYLANANSCRTKRLVVWFDADKTTFNSFADFGQELENYWAIENGYVFKKVELKHGKPKNERDARKVATDLDSMVVYLQELDANSTDASMVRKAPIAVYGGQGRLVQEQYELSSEALEKENGRCYNIGRGEFPTLGGGVFRRNHIAIDDNGSNEANKYVSRTHAHIGFSEVVGFYLQVEFGGSRLSGNRTRIFRGEEKIEVENVEVKAPLRDGDLIELGKAVVLQFVEIE